MEGRNGLGPYLSLWVFGIAFGLIEAVVVIYLRELSGLRDEPLFPLLSQALGAHRWLFRVEIYREAATLILMLPAAYLFSNRLFERFLAYCVIFGVWELAYYGFLHLLTGWPSSLLAYDVLFLIPTVWVAPVICPMLVAVGLVLFGTAYLLLARRRMPRDPSVWHLAVALAGGALVVWSFVDHADYYLAGGTPPRFSWFLYAAGMFVASLAGGYFLGHYAQQPKTRFF